MVNKEISFQEFKKAFKTLKQNKVIGCDIINSCIIIDVYDSIKVILFKISKASFEEAAFPENLKSQKLFQFFKKGKIKMLKTNDRLLFFQFFFPKYLTVSCVIVCMNIS